MRKKNPASLVESATGIHHYPYNTYWAINTSAIRGPEEEQESEECSTSRGKKVDRADMRQREKEEVRSLRADLLKAYIKSRRRNEACGGYMQSV